MPKKVAACNTRTAANTQAILASISKQSAIILQRFDLNNVETSLGKIVRFPPLRTREILIIHKWKTTIRNTFGVGRFNTRLNFYLFEINRLSFLQRKSFYLHRFTKNTSMSKTELNLINLSNTDPTLFSYRFYNK